MTENKTETKPTKESITQEIYAKLDAGSTVANIAEWLSLDDKLILAKGIKSRRRYWYHTPALPKWKKKASVKIEAKQCKTTEDLEKEVQAVMVCLNEEIAKNKLQELEFGTNSGGYITVSGIKGTAEGNKELIQKLIPAYKRKKAKEKREADAAKKKIEKAAKKAKEKAVNDAQKAKNKVAAAEKRAKEKAKKAKKTAKDKALKTKLKKALANATGIKDSEAAQLLSLFACKK